MDFLTALPYIGIILLVTINAWLVTTLDITIEDEE